MHFHFLSVSLFFIGACVSVATQDLFTNYDSTDGNLMNIEGSGPISSEGNGNELLQVENGGSDTLSTSNTDIWDSSGNLPVSFGTNGDVALNTDLLAGGCPSNNRLGARNEETLCPNPETQNTERLHLPSLEDLTDKVGSLQGKKPDDSCTPLRPNHLCCDCPGWNNFLLCVDCTPCKLCSSPHLCCSRIPLKPYFKASKDKERIFYLIHSEKRLTSESR